ncbi:MAG: hypothetical protein AAGB10_12530 [Pseudomonadota bacterium]
MDTFDTLQSDLAAAQSAEKAAKGALFADEQRLAQAERRRKQAERLAQTDTAGAPDPLLAQIDSEIEARRADVSARRDALDRARAEAADRLAPFLDLTDPREHIGNLSDATPILLMPLRIETRFRQAQDGQDTPELWVRVFPDDFAVETFEETLSESEYRRIRTYWTNVWRAGGVEADARGAWKVLAGAVGSGRAFWLQQTYVPLNTEERPVKEDGVASVVLVIASEESLVSPEADALAIYWEAVWRAGDNAIARATADQQLALTLGDTRAGELRGSHIPANLTDPPPDGTDRATVSVQVTYVLFPPADTVPLRESGWTQAPTVRLMPDRLVLLGYNNEEVTLERLGEPIPDSLVVAPDPSAAEEDQIAPDGDDITLGTELEWIADFDKAVEIGMGFRIPMDPVAFRTGFDRLMVLGVRLKSSAEAGKTALEGLITQHKQSRAGIQILPQGTPTNNVEAAGAGYTRTTDADASFDRYFGSAPQGAPPSGWYDKQDGQWLAELLGLDPSVVADVDGATNRDIADARAMNVLLWPATGGYFMDALLDTVFDNDTVRAARNHFIRHVIARGPLPALRVGRQPYGILPATPRSRIGWLRPRPLTENTAGTAVPLGGNLRFLQRLYSVLRLVEFDWRTLDDQVSWIGKPGVDQHQVLLDVVGLHPGSVEHYQRYAESYTQLYNRMRLQGAGGQFAAALIALGYTVSGQQLLTRLGHIPDPEAGLPDILEKLFLRQPGLLTGGLIQDVDLSEVEPVRIYTDSGENYLEWLQAAAGTSHDALRKQEGFADGPPNALLYLMGRHALDLSFVEVSQILLVDAGLITPTEFQARRREAPFLHVLSDGLAEPEQAMESRWAPLYRAEPVITGGQTITLGEHIAKIVKTHVATAYLGRQLDALDRLKDRPSAALERAFAEHLDLMTYRLDAWYGSLLSFQLEAMRYPPDPPAQDLDGDGQVDTISDGPTGPRQGLYLGAYGWLEDVKPEFRTLTPVDDLPPDLAAVFQRDGDAPLTRDNRNAGYIHAPSLNHAVTAAVLRNGYLSNATPDNPGSLAINLSSERVRLALQVIEGLKGGQSLGALLGYQFERGLHDKHTVEVDAFIYELRQAFPIASGRLRPTRVGRQDELGRRIRMRQVEARNVIDGVALVEHMRKTGNRSYPFGLTDLPAATAAQAAAITAEADRIDNICDATADLAMAESVHQVVQGNYDRAGATLDTFSKGKFPQTPDVIRTPRSGTGLTHRVGLHLVTGLDPATPGLGPRARAEPALDAWVADILPDPARVAAQVRLIDPDDATETEVIVTQSDLGLSALDLLYALNVDGDRAMRKLDDLIEAHVIAAQTPRPDVDIAIDYVLRLETVTDHVPFFELGALTKGLRGLLLRSRPLRATDLALSQEAERDSEQQVSLEPERITLNRDALAAAATSLAAFHPPLDTLLEAERTPDNIAQIVSGVDGNISAFIAFMGDLSPYTEFRTGTGQIFADRRRIHAQLRAVLADYIARWVARLDEFDIEITAYDDLPADTPDDQRFLSLQKAERRIVVSPTETLPPTPDQFRADLVDGRRADFVAQRLALEAMRATETSISGLVAAIDTAAPANAEFDTEAIDIGDAALQAVALVQDMARRAAALVETLNTRVSSVDTLLAEAAAAAEPKSAVAALTKAAEHMFGEDFKVVPSFTLTGPQAQELGTAWGPGPQADTALLDHLEGTLGRPFPIDDWLHGIARVREKMRDLEVSSLLAEAFGSATIALQALQLPHRAGLPWLAMDLPATHPDGSPFSVDEDKLLYTAHYSTPLVPSGSLAGLLLDEWTETLPTRTEETGLAVHFDRPNSEAPQSLLLALPADFTGSWGWQDLVDTVRETMDMARLRAIEPDQIDTTAYARFLPATTSAVTFKPITAALNLAFNNGLAAALATQEGSDE